MACQKSSLIGMPAIAGPGAAAPAADSPRLRMLALGDSYTIGESVSQSDRYPVQAVKKLCADDRLCFADPEIIATTGWTTGNLLDALAVDKPAGPYDVVTLLIGVNNQYQGRSLDEYKTQLRTLLQASIQLAGNRPSHVLVLSVPDYSVTPYGQSTGRAAAIATAIDSFNGIARQLSADCKVGWLDVTAESRKAATDATLIAGDGLHFSGKEYAIWAGLMEPVIKGMWR